MNPKLTLVDGHLDIACNIRRLGRGDLSLPSRHYREKEGRLALPLQCSVTFPEMRQAGLRLIFATLFESPADHGVTGTEAILNEWPPMAERLFRDQIETYRSLEAAHPDFSPVCGGKDLDTVLHDEHSLGYVILMEGADAIRSPGDVKAWKDLGVRIVGLHWNNPSRYGGSCHHPGPLTDSGRELLKELHRHGILLDLSHASEETCHDAFDAFEGTIVITHSSSRSLVPKERLTSDAVFDRLIERNGVIGMALFSPFLNAECSRSRASLEDVVRHIDHFAQRAGNTRHLALGSDLDGGFGAEMIPREMDTVADLPKIAEALLQHGYAVEDVRGIMGENWVRVLRGAWENTYGKPIL